MADDKQQDSPSADEIVDDMAADMGVEDEQVPQDSADDGMDGLGGIFDVPTSKGRTSPGDDDEHTGSPAAEQALSAAESAELGDGQDQTAAADNTADDSRADAADPSTTTDSEATTVGADDSSGDPDAHASVADASSSPSKPSTASELGELGGVLDPSGSSDTAISERGGPGDHLGEDDIGEVSSGSGGTSTPVILLSLVVVVLLAVIAFVVVQFTDIGGDIAALFEGNFKQRKMAEAQRKKEEWNAAQKAKLEHYGNLTVSGTPIYSLVKLDGQVQYGQTSSGAWRDLRISTAGAVFKNLKVKNKHTIDVSAPGFKPETTKLTEGMWQGGSSGPYSYSKRLGVDLIPKSGQHQLEFETRLDTSDTENDYYGAVSINSIPAGAKIRFDNHPLLDENGEEMVTPVTFESYWVKDEDTGHLEETKVNVDTPPDRGHKVQLAVPEDKGEFPKYVTALQRRMWTCKWKDGQAPTSPPSGKTFRDLCEYTFGLDMDFNNLKSYIERRKAEKKRIEEKNAKLRAEQAKQAKERAAE